MTVQHKDHCIPLSRTGQIILRIWVFACTFFYHSSKERTAIYRGKYLCSNIFLNETSVFSSKMTSHYSNHQKRQKCFQTKICTIDGNTFLRIQAQEQKSSRLLRQSFILEPAKLRQNYMKNKTRLKANIQSFRKGRSHLHNANRCDNFDVKYQHKCQIKIGHE